ncbi:signal peptidase II [Paraferrimonas sedimenticola]|uniref:Lipoprotein signal peptidase n=1 Tax=Paraferrimonas sedimenticola TaxID=375674 RepID=A0AA37RZ21_9GAMM|nr:signal peptidase II [Paraferrimonas sedimenticola]GLP97147.1 lipoprotein signal peptidase [Paraferrimonas sedimenticola]
MDYPKPNQWQQSGLPWLWVALVMLGLDQLTKYLVLQNFSLHQVEAILPVFNLTYVRNYGAAFSFLHDAGGWQRWFFTALAVGVSLLLSWWLRNQPKALWRLNLCYALIIGGAIGNLIDRLVHGYVVDFLDFYWGTAHFPAFNVADMAISVGAGLLILEAFWPQKLPGYQANQE